MLSAVSSSKGTGPSTVMDNKSVVADGKEIVMELARDCGDSLIYVCF